MPLSSIFADSSRSVEADRLFYIVRTIAAKWGDNNISTGTTTMNLMNIRGDELDEALGREIFGSNFLEYSPLDRKDGETVLSKLKLKTKVMELNERSVTRMAKAVALGNAYDPKNQGSVEELVKDIWAATINLGAQGANVVETSSQYEAEEGEGPRAIYNYVIRSERANRVVTIFVIEGTM